MQNQKRDNRKPFDDIRLVKYLKEKKDSKFIENLAETFNESREILDNRIPQIFSQYTLHDINHSVRIMEHIADIIGDLSSIEELDLVVLIYSSLLHDIGMGILKDEDIELLKKNNHETFKGKIDFQSVLEEYNNNEKLATQECIRQYHAKLSANFILSSLQHRMVIPSQPVLSFAEDLAKICESHTEDFTWIESNLKTEKILGDYKFNPQFCACLLRLGDILDIDNNRTPYNLYKIINPYGISNDEWKQHFIIHNNQKVSYDEENKAKKVEFRGQCNDASVHRKFLEYVRWVNSELKNSIELTKSMKKNYQINLLPVSSIQIDPKGYSIPNLKMNINYGTISKLLMGENIYGNNIYGLRELIQNSMDACRVRKELHFKNRKLGDEGYSPSIRVIFNEEDNTVVIKDNGMGMDKNIIKNHFLNIGNSYYNSKDFKFKGNKYSPIGNFGIGFLSCFMLSDKIKVKTKHFNSNLLYEIELEKGSEFITLKEEKDSSFSGTEIILDLNQFLEYTDFNFDQVFNFLKNHFLTEDVKLIAILKSSDELEIEEKPIITKLKSNPSLIGKNNIEIDLSNHLIGIEGFIELKINDISIGSLNDILVDGETYYLKGEDKLVELSLLENGDFLELSRQINKNQRLKVLNVHIVNDENYNEFEKRYEALDEDLFETYDRLHFEEYLTIILNESYANEKFTNSEFEPYEKIIGNIGVSDLEKLGHYDEYGVIVNEKTLHLFQCDDTGLVLVFQKSRSPYTAKSIIYLKGVVLENYQVSLFNLPRIIEVISYGINIIDKNIKPNIERTRLLKNHRSEVNYVLNKVIVKGILESKILEPIKNKVLQNFYEKIFNKKSYLER